MRRQRTVLSARGRGDDQTRGREKEKMMTNNEQNPTQRIVEEWANGKTETRVNIRLDENHGGTIEITQSYDDTLGQVVFGQDELPVLINALITADRAIWHLREAKAAEDATQTATLAAQNSDSFYKD